jgi:hypothetical protein
MGGKHAYRPYGTCSTSHSTRHFRAGLSHAAPLGLGLLCCELLLNYYEGARDFVQHCGEVIG